MSALSIEYEYLIIKLTLFLASFHSRTGSLFEYLSRH